jgi:hypothetical protein
MNGKKIACLLLIMIIASVVYGTQTMQHAATDMQKEKETANDEFVVADTECFKQEAALARHTEETRELRQFLSTWTPIINRFQSSQDAEQELMRTIRNSSLLTLSQKFEVRTNTTNPLVPKSLLASLTVQDDFSKTMNWLGEIERKLPVARITSCRLKKGDAGGRVNLEVHFEVPLISLQAAFEEAKKKTADVPKKS